MMSHRVGMYRDRVSLTLAAMSDDGAAMSGFWATGLAAARQRVAEGEPDGANARILLTFVHAPG
jgi:hypothetical protein